VKVGGSYTDDDHEKPNNPKIGFVLAQGGIEAPADKTCEDHGEAREGVPEFDNEGLKG